MTETTARQMPATLSNSVIQDITMRKASNDRIEKRKIPFPHSEQLEDGTLHKWDTLIDADVVICGKCGKPKTWMGLIEKNEMMNCISLCDCEQKAEEQKRKEYAEKDRRQKVRELRAVGFNEERLKKYNFKNDRNPDSNYSKIAKNFVKAFPVTRDTAQPGLFICGTPGTGKTFYAMCIANELIEQGFRVFVGSMQFIISNLMHKKPTLEINEIPNFDLIVIDDYGTESSGRFVDLSFSYIDACIRSQTPMIITTNLTKNEIQNYDGKGRIYSRLVEACYPVEMIGEDLRQKTQKENNEKYKRLYEPWSVNAKNE